MTDRKEIESLIQKVLLSGGFVSVTTEKETGHILELRVTNLKGVWEGPFSPLHFAESMRQYFYSETSPGYLGKEVTA